MVREHWARGGPSPPPVGQADNLYVKYLPAEFNNDDVRELFRPYGPVKSMKLLPLVVDSPIGGHDPESSHNSSTTFTECSNSRSWGAESSPLAFYTPSGTRWDPAESPPQDDNKERVRSGKTAPYQGGGLAGRDSNIPSGGYNIQDRGTQSWAQPQQQQQQPPDGPGFMVQDNRWEARREPSSRTSEKSPPWKTESSQTRQQQRPPWKKDSEGPLQVQARNQDFRDSEALTEEVTVAESKAPVRPEPKVQSIEASVPTAPDSAEFESKVEAQKRGPENALASSDQRTEDASNTRSAPPNTSLSFHSEEPKPKFQLPRRVALKKPRG